MNHHQDLLQVLHQKAQVLFHLAVLVDHLVVALVEAQVDHQVYLHQAVRLEAQVYLHLVFLQDPLVEGHQFHLVNRLVEAFTQAVLHQKAQLRAQLLA